MVRFVSDQEQGEAEDEKLKGMLGRIEAFRDGGSRYVPPTKPPNPPRFTPGNEREGEDSRLWKDIWIIN